MRRRVIAVTGTPGTGKSDFAKILAKSLGAERVDLNEMITKKGAFRLGAGGEKVAKLPVMRREFSRLLRSVEGDLVVEGLLAHLLPRRLLTHIVVLRTKPKVLERRLRKRGYTGEKLKDNLEAEALDVILWEAVEGHGLQKVYEIDTTRRSPRASVRLFMDALQKKTSLEPGGVSWLEEFYRRR